MPSPGGPAGPGGPGLPVLPLNSRTRLFRERQTVCLSQSPQQLSNLTHTFTSQIEILFVWTCGMKQKLWTQSLITVDGHGVVLKAMKLSYTAVILFGV